MYSSFFLTITTENPEADYIVKKVRIWWNIGMEVQIQKTTSLLSVSWPSAKVVQNTTWRETVCVYTHLHLVSYMLLLLIKPPKLIAGSPLWCPDLIQITSQTLYCQASLLMKFPSTLDLTVGTKFQHRKPRRHFNCFQVTTVCLTEEMTELLPVCWWQDEQ